MIATSSGLLLACSSGFEIYRRADDRIVLYDTETRAFYVLHDIDELGAYVPDAKCQQIKRALLDHRSKTRIDTRIDQVALGIEEDANRFLLRQRRC